MSVPAVKLNDGRSMPQLGIGVWQVSPSEAVPTIYEALKIGYRSVDTAAAYENEEGVGEAIRLSEVPRDDIFLTTKLWNPHHGKAEEAIDESLAQLGLNFVDLYLIHWPAPKQNLYVQAWKSLVKIREAGKALSIGVSNFTIEQLREVIDATGVVPTVNQVEMHPLFPQEELRAFHAEHGIVTESWSPLGRGRLTDHSVLIEIGRKHGKSLAQVVLRWHLELGVVAIPKSVTLCRIQENFELFDFQLDADDMAAIAGLNTGERLGGDPNLANYGIA